MCQNTQIYVPLLQYLKHEVVIEGLEHFAQKRAGETH